MLSFPGHSNESLAPLLRKVSLNIALANALRIPGQLLMILQLGWLLDPESI